LNSQHFKDVNSRRQIQFKNETVIEKVETKVEDFK